MPTETKIQAFIHKLEEGGWAKWLRLSVLLAAILAMSYLWLYGDNGFKGLAHPCAFEQAEIAREIARGHGFSTKFFRPAALYQLREHKGGFSIEQTPDTYQAPLWPVLLAPCISLVKSTWAMTTKDVLYESDRMVALAATVFFLLAVGVNYFLARRLFDHRLALIGVGLILVSDHIWRFSMTGLPQMLMLFLFSSAMYALLRAVEKQEQFKAGLAAVEEPLADFDPEFSGERSAEAPLVNPLGPAPIILERRPSLFRGPLPWLAASAVLFGLLALSHAITIWIFAGALIFCLIYFRPLGLYAGIMLALFAVCYTPWLMRNFRVSGTPFGVSWYSGLYQIRGSEQSIMRSSAPPLAGVTPTFFRRKVIAQTEVQMRNLYGLLGSVIAAPFFFISLLHLFRRRSTSVFRWAVLLCWILAVLGMSVFGLDTETFQANDLHLLFIPLTTFYGLAFILVLWSRLELRVRLVQVAFLGMLFFLSGYTFLFSVLDLLGKAGSRVQWPPYVPPYISLLGSWTTEREVIMSDMPWAVAWYADRRSLWLPTSVDEFLRMNDWDVLQGRIVGLHLTPVSGDVAFLSGVVKGDYKEWAPFIMRNANLRNFPLKAVTPLPIDNMCVFYADRDRWNTRED